MSDPAADPAAHPLVSYTHTGYNDLGSEDDQILRPADYENDTHDFGTNENSTRAPIPSHQRMRHMQYSSSSSTLPNEAGNKEPDPNLQSHYARKFSPRNQLLALLFKGFLRFMLTVVLILCLLVTILIFQRYDVIGEAKKRIFNTLVTALSMTLGISIGSSFKDVALDLRWWFLSRKKRPLQEVDEILECSSLRDVARLAARSSRKLELGITLTCAFWVLINIAAQACVAMLSLTFTFGISNVSLGPVIGDVVFTNMSQSFGTSFDEDNEPSSQLAAHTLGETAIQFTLQTFASDNSENLPVQPLASYMSNPIDYWNTTTYFQYCFTESPSDSTSQVGLFYSNRSITTRSECKVYTVLNNTDGSSSTFNYSQDGTTQTMQFQSLGPNSTTYYTSPDLPDCGPRCASVFAFENNGEAAFYYECQVNVSDVANATLPEHVVPDSHAKMAAGAIALQGYQAQGNPKQYQTFPSQSIYGRAQNGNSDGMAVLMRNFAIGVFVAADRVMPLIDPPASELLPGQGSMLVMNNPTGMYAIFASLAAVHFLLFVLGAFFANRVLVVDDNYLAIAILLQPVINKMANRGFLLGGEKSWDMVKDLEVAYGHTNFEKGKGGVQGLAISEDAYLKKSASAWECYYDS